MKFDIDKYEIISKIFIGTNLKFVFKNIFEPADKKVLELKEVVGFIDNSHSNEQIKTLRIDVEGSSYTLDLSIRLQKAEINNFPEVFIFLDTSCINFCFRAVAGLIEFREWNSNDKWLP